MSMTLSKTDYLIYRDCKKNAWLKINKPDIYSQFPLSEFELSLMENGRDIEELARKLFPSGILVSGRGSEAQTKTQKLLEEKTPVIFQAVFSKDNFLAAVDVLKYNFESNSYSIFEIKSKSSLDKEFYYDLAFQINLLKKFGLKIDSANLIYLNSEYVRSGELNINVLFKIEDVTQKVEELLEEVSIEMESALNYLSQKLDDANQCMCIYRGRSKHCTTFSISNPKVPKYSVHDINRIGNSKRKLAEMIDGGVFELDKVPLHIQLSPFQQRQVESYKLNKIFIDKDSISIELKSLEFPLYFLDYESFPSPVPMFDGFSPYSQLPFQYSLHILKDSSSELEHAEFLHSESGDPTRKLIESLRGVVGNKGSIIVWHKNFECITINEQIANRLPEFRDFIDGLNSRVYDLEEIFLKMYYVNKNFLGRTSIKNILPVLVPELSYKELSIQQGTTAFLRWRDLFSDALGEDQKNQIINDLKIYCGQDSLAMYKILQHLQAL